MATVTAGRGTHSVETSLVGHGRYRIEAQLGRGGAAAVYRGYEIGSERKVAIKRLLAGAGPHMTSLFELEYHTLSSLRHPNIVEVWDYGTDEVGPFYVMELLEGADLSGRSGLGWQEVATYAIGVAQALSTIHARKLVHRDVSARNIWRLPSGQVKLIDFGALAPFGVPGHLVGTPPHVAPEALFGRPVDQRCDLYALGSILYWLLSGVHAYPARSLRDLPAIWTQPAVALNDRLRDQGREPVPAELEALVMALISENPMARPSTTGEVIDLLSALLGIESRGGGARELIALGQPALVGRERERADLARRLEQVRAGHGECTTYVGQRGAGRSRLLLELTTDARIRGFSVLHVGAKECVGGHGVALALLHRLLDALPEFAEQAVRAHADVLAHLSRATQKRLGVERLRPMPPVAGEARAAIHESLSELFVAVARKAPLALLVDDFDSADEASCAWLAEMSERLGHEAIWLGLTLSDERAGESSYAQRVVRQQSRRVVLKPIAGSETQKLLSSLFGEVPHLVRLAERIHRSTHGLPGRIVDAAKRLVREGLIENAEGTWVLPQDVPSGELSADQQEGARQRVDRLSARARALGALLSLRRGFIPLELCKALSPLPARELFESLEELVREGVLSAARGGYLFQDALLVSLLAEQLTAAVAAEAHRRLGEFLLARGGGSPAEELDALVHLMQGGDGESAPRRIARLAVELQKDDPDEAIEAVPSLERALELFRERGFRDADLLGLLGALAVCGFFSERSLAQRHGAAALAAAERTVGIDLVRKLRPYLGRMLGLMVGISLGALRARFRAHFAPTLPERLELFFNITGSLAGVATICVDLAAIDRCLDLTEPFAVLGKANPAGMAHEFISSLRVTVRDCPAEASARWRAIIAALEDPKQLRRVPEQVRLRFLGGAMYALGTLEAWAESAEALQLADQLERFQLKLYEMMADQVRTVYYGHQGDGELYARYRDRVELHAIRRGSAWQVETWAPAADIAFAMRVHDAMTLKESSEQLRRLVERVPGLQTLAQRARGGYLYQRRRYEEAISVLEQCVADPENRLVAWAGTHGMLGACFNRLGRHGEAKQVIARALAVSPPANLRFTGININLRNELAVAEAGLGNRQAAEELIEQVCQDHYAKAGPLTRGSLHYTRARVALLLGDFTRCELEAHEMEQSYQQTGIPSLIAMCQSFARQRAQAARSTDGSAAESAGEMSSGVFNGQSFERELSQSDDDLPTYAERGLDLLTRSLGPVDGGLFVLRDGQVFLIAKLGKTKLPEALKDWVLVRLLEAQADDVTCTEALDESIRDRDLFVQGGQRYRLFPLAAARAGCPTVVGAVIFAEPSDARHFLSRELLDVFAERVLYDLDSTNPSELTLTEASLQTQPS